MKSLKYFLNSLRTKVIMVLIAACVPVMVLYFAMNYYSMRMVEERIYEHARDMLNSNMRRLDAGLEKVSDYLVNIRSNNHGVYQFASLDSRKQYNISIELSQDLVENIMAFDAAEGILCCSATNGKRIYSFNVHSSVYAERMKIIEYVQTHVKELARVSGNWTPVKIGEEYVLLYPVGDETVMFCAWTSFATLSEPLKDWNLLEDSVCCFVDSGDRILQVVSGKEQAEAVMKGDPEGSSLAGRKKYIMTSVSSGKGNFQIRNAVARSRLMGGFDRLWVCSVGLIFLFLGGAMPASIHVLRKNVFFPVRSLEAGMEKIEGGDLEVQVEKDHPPNELGYLIDSFNSMTSQIKTLKIQSYEEALERRKVEMDYLQLQIEPHFYLNALNLIHTMAEVGDTSLIQQVTQNLSLYLRYVLGSRDRDVTLEEELKNIESYLKIMEIRFGESFQYEENVDECLMSMSIPPLLLQLPVENSLKYAFDVYGEDNRIILSVFREGDDAVFRVEDNGNGYSEEVLKRFRNQEPPKDRHIGLWNLKMRLEYMYHGDAGFSISNREPHGARTEIRIRYPMREDAPAGDKEGTGDESADRR